MADIFVALTPFTKECVIFGKNANQPPTDVQQVIYCAGADYTTGSKVKTDSRKIGFRQVRCSDCDVTDRSAWAGREVWSGHPRPYCGVFLIADKGEAWLVECAGKSWVAKQITGSFTTKDMFEILRKMAIEDSRQLQTTGSHVTILSSAGLPDSHWFTGTPCPSLSVFKPFMFSDNVDIGDYTRSLSTDDKRHVLYKYHEKARELMASGSPKGEALSQLMRSLEGKCVVEVDEFCQQFSVENISDVDELFKDICESEIKFYL